MVFIQILKQITLKNNDRNKRFRGDTSGLALPHTGSCYWYSIK